MTAEANRRGTGIVLPRRWRLVSGRARSRKGGTSEILIGAAILGIMLVIAALAPVLAPVDPLRQDVMAALLPPGTPGHPLGTDALGRDVLSRLLYGAQVDLFLAIAAVVLPFGIGLTVGAVAGYFGGVFDRVVVAIINVVYAFPMLVLLIALVFVLGPGIPTIIVAITLIAWVAYARLARDLVRRERAKEYVQAAKVTGVPTGRILFGHVFPNVVAQPVIFATSDIVATMLFITSLGFLGLGVPAPTPDWGTMISEAQPYMGVAPWMAIFPGLSIATAGLALALIADGLARRWDAE
ncbi:ABC transporter permease [Microbacterium tumbae]